MLTRSDLAVLMLGVTVVGSFAGCAATATRGGAETPPPAATASQAAPSDVKWELEPKAVELLKATSKRLAAAHALQFTAVVSYESPSRLGPPARLYDQVRGRRAATLIGCASSRPPTVRGPEFYYDGKTITAFAPKEDLAAIADAPPTIDRRLEGRVRPG